MRSLHTAWGIETELFGIAVRMEKSQGLICCYLYSFNIYSISGLLDVSIYTHDFIII